ncbi:ribonuclease H-like domain-containing protein [Limtongia smithiae]|uniref:ribonuclease H-like domain-containing protein n=1 Tax=Limtongia smithiae TaxID=1125753 RepID=UPI0034CE95AF
MGGSTGVTSKLVWIDCEMTGLDVYNDRILELACFVTTWDLTPVEPNGMEEVIYCPPEVLDQMDDWCKAQHSQSGLVARVLASSMTAAKVEAKLLKYLRDECGIIERNSGVLAGNSVHMDKEFLRREMPQLLAYLNYRVIDVSTLKELSRRRNPSVYVSAPVKKNRHTAKSDILESIEELRHYYETFLITDMPDK